ncbi:MAG: DUF1540 domain-containing protein [Pseudoflavonifractor sp.]
MNTTNPAIKCSVESCAHHSGTSSCTMSEICVGCTSAEVQTCTGTKCASFQLGDHGGCCKH